MSKEIEVINRREFLVGAIAAAGSAGRVRRVLAVPSTLFARGNDHFPESADDADGPGFPDGFL